MSGADLAKVKFSHFDKQTNIVSGKDLDLQKFIDGKAQKSDERMALNPPLNIGDIIIVPIKGAHRSLFDYLSPVSGALGLITTTKYLSQ